MKTAFACKWDSITVPSMHMRVADFARRTAWKLIVPACLLVLALCTMSRAEQEGRLDIKVRQMINEAMDDEVLDAPYAVEVNDRGDVYVADTANNRVIKYIGGDFKRPIYYPPQSAVGK